MKILDVTEFWSERGGGVRSHLTTKSHVLCQLGHTHVVVAPGPADDGPEAPKGSEVARRAEGGPRSAARVVRVRGPALPYDPTYHLLWRVRAVHRVIARERPDVLEIHSPYVAALAALTAPRGTFGVRTMQWHADFIDTYLRGPVERLVRTEGRADRVVEPLWAWVRALGARSRAVLVASAWQEDKLRAHGVAHTVRHPFGVDRTLFRPERASAAVRARLLGPGREGAALVVGVGRFAHEKRWEVVLDAFARVRAARDAVLVLFGDGPERGRLEARAAGSPDVRLPGFERDREALADALASADVLLHGCADETFGLSIAEAHASGLPAVVPDRGGAAEIVGPASGATYPAGDAEACARAALALLARRDRAPDALRRAAVDAIRELPSVEQQFARQIALYEGLLAQPPAR